MQNRDLINRQSVSERAGAGSPERRPGNDSPHFEGPHGDGRSSPEHGPPSAGALQYVRILWRRKGSILVVAFLGALLGFVFLLPQTPVYRASASVEIQAVNEDFLYARESNPSSSQGNLYPELDLATQAKLLRTKALSSRTKARVAADPSLHIKVPADRMTAWRKALHLPASAPPSEEQMIADTASSVVITAPRNTRIIEISCDSGDPKLAATFANTLATEYIDQTLEARWQSAKHTGEWLGRQLDEMKIKLEHSEEQLQSYAAAMNLVVTGVGTGVGGDKDRSNIAEEKLRQVQTELSVAEAERVARQARFEMAAAGRTDSLGQVLDDGTLRAYELKLADLRRELADLSSTLTPAHYKVQKLQAQIAEMESEQKKSKDRIVERIGGDFREAERREKLLGAKYQAQSALVSNQAGKLVHYGLLQREVDTNRQLYETLLHKVKEAAISAALRASNIRVVDPAQAPQAPYAPDFLRGTAVGLFFGLFGGVGLALLQERTNRSIQVPADASFYLQVPLLGVIPSYVLDRVPTARQIESPPAGLFTGDGTGNQALSQRAKREPRNPVLSDFQGNKSAVAEAFRAVLTSILFTGRRHPAQVLVVSSPNVSEGKTTVACNLAMAYCEAGRTVLLIDCDMRRPRLHEIFEVSNRIGLASMLTEREPLDTRSLLFHVHGTKIAGLSLLPSGMPAGGTANLLHSRRMGEFIELAREQFDVVLLDTPPMLQLADARIVGSLADGLVLVIRAGQSTRDAALAARQQLGEDGVPVVGVVLNDWNPKFSDYYGYEQYGKGYYSSTAAGEEASGKSGQSGNAS